MVEDLISLEIENMNPAELLFITFICFLNSIYKQLYSVDGPIILMKAKGLYLIRIFAEYLHKLMQ